MSRPSPPNIICTAIIVLFALYSVIDSAWLHTDFSRNNAGTWHQCATTPYHVAPVTGAPVTVRCLEGTVTLDFRSGK